MAGWAYDWLHWPWQHTWSASAGPCAKTDTEVTLHGDGVGRRAYRRAELGRLIHMRPPVHAAVPSNSSAYRRHHHHRGFGGETPLVEREETTVRLRQQLQTAGPRIAADPINNIGAVARLLTATPGATRCLDSSSQPNVSQATTSPSTRSRDRRCCLGCPLLLFPSPRHSPTVRPSALLSSRVPLAAQDHPGVDRARRREEVRVPTLSDTRLV